MTAREIDASISRAGDCWDNAVVESLFATLEWGLLDSSPLRSHAGMTHALVQFIDGWHTRARMHSTLGYRSPMQYEQDLLRTTRAACTPVSTKSGEVQGSLIDPRPLPDISQWAPPDYDEVVQMLAGSDRMMQNRSSSVVHNKNE